VVDIEDRPTAKPEEEEKKEEQVATPEPAKEKIV